MAREPDPDAEIDDLYRLPPSEFIPARNALARRAGPRAGEIRALQKPTLPAWAINQLYWQERGVYDDLIARARDLRATHDAALRGKAADVRGASRAHEEAVDAALKATVALLDRSGETATDSTRQAIATTLRGLPADSPPGRLVRPLQPRGFEMLSSALAPGRVRAASPAATAKQKKAAAPESKATARRRQAARQALDTAERVRKDAEGLVRREEFEAARAAREAEKALRRLADARRTLEEAEAAVSEAERASAAAVKLRDAARERAARAAERLETARDRETAAREDLDGAEQAP